MSCLYADTGDNNYLRQAVVPVTNWEACSNASGSHKYYMKPQYICTGKLGKGACHGDSGGPAVCKQGDRWFDYGVAAFRISPCGDKPLVYMNVVHFLPWIQDKTGSLYLYVKYQCHFKNFVVMILITCCRPCSETCSSCVLAPSPTRLFTYRLRSFLLGNNGKPMFH